MYKGLPLGRRLNWARDFYHVTRVDYVISSRCLRAKCRIIFMQTIENGFWKVDNTTLIFVFMPALSYWFYFTFRLNKSYQNRDALWERRSCKSDVRLLLSRSEGRRRADICYYKLRRDRWNNIKMAMSEQGLKSNVKFRLINTQ